MNVLRINMLIFVGLLCVLWQPVTSYGTEKETADVIIGYKDNIGKQFILKHNESVERHFENLSAFAVKIAVNDRGFYEENKHITYIEDNVPVTLSNSGESISEIKNGDALVEGETWNLRSSRFSFAWEEGITGKGINIAVIDTGVSPQADLEVAGGVSTVDYTEKWQDDNGHGTHVAGVIGAEQNERGVVGVAPDANLFAVKALDSNGKGQMADLLEAIEWSIQHDMDIINLSLGTEFHSDALDKMMNQAYEAGVLIVGASGNGEGDGKVMYPAKYESVIAVSAVDEQLHAAPFSSIGAEVEFSAPGTNIISTYVNESYGIASGTSQASPHISGMLALLQQKFPNKNPEDRRKLLADYVQDVGETGRDPFFGFGRVSYITDFTPPKEIIDLKLHETEKDSFTIQWVNPNDEDFEKTVIYLNDSLIKETDKQNETSYTFTELEANKAYNIAIYTEDLYGNRSKGVIQTVQVMESGLIIAEKSKQNTDEQEESANEQKQEKENAKEAPEKDDAPPQAKDENEQKDKQSEISIPAPVNDDQARTDEPKEETENIEEEKNQREEDDLSASGSTDASIAEEENEEEEQSESVDIDKEAAKAEHNTAPAVDEVNKNEDNDKNLFSQFFSWIGELFRTIFQSLANLI